MRKSSIILAFIFAIIGIVLTVLPMGTIAFIPIGMALIFSIIAYVTSEAGHKNIPKWLLIISIISLIVVLVRSFIPDEVAQDKQFEQKMIESKQEDLKDLEGLE